MAIFPISCDFSWKACKLQKSRKCGVKRTPCGWMLYVIVFSKLFYKSKQKTQQLSSLNLSYRTRAHVLHMNLGRQLCESLPVKNFIFRKVSSSKRKHGGKQFAWFWWKITPRQKLVATKRASKKMFRFRIATSATFKLRTCLWTFGLDVVWNKCNVIWNSILK